MPRAASAAARTSGSGGIEERRHLDGGERLVKGNSEVAEAPQRVGVQTKRIGGAFAERGQPGLDRDAA